MVNPWRYQSPDSRLRFLKFALDQEAKRSARLDEMDARRKMQLDQQMQRETQRSADLDQRDSIQEQMQVEQARSADLDRREAQEVARGREEGMARFREVEQRQQPQMPRPLAPTWEPGMERFRGVEQAQQPSAPTPRRVYPGGEMGPKLTPGFAEAEAFAGGAKFTPEGGTRGFQEFYEAYRANLDIRLAGLERTNQRRALDDLPPLTEEDADLAARQFAQRQLEMRGAVQRGWGTALEAVDYPRQMVKEHIIEPVVPEFDLTIPKEVFWATGRLEKEDVTITSGMVEEAASWILDPLNLLPVVGWGPDLLRAAKAARRGTPAALKGLLKNPEVRNFLKTVTSEAGGPRVPGGRLRPTAPEGMRLTNDIPATSEIRAQLVKIDAELAKPKIKGGRPAMLEERAKLQAQADIDEVLSSGLPVEEQFRALEAELEGLRIELQTRGLPFRGKWPSRKFVPQEKDMPMGGLTAEERAARPSAAESRAARTARAEQRYPDLSTGEVNAQERVYNEFIKNAKFEEVPAEEALVGRARFTPEGEVVREPTYATEAELAGIRPRQAELGIGAGERPIETAGPMFERRAGVFEPAPPGTLQLPPGGRAALPPPTPRAIVSVLDDVVQEALEPTIRSPEVIERLARESATLTSPPWERPIPLMGRREVDDAIATVPPGGGAEPPVGITAGGESLSRPPTGRLMPELPSLEEVMAEGFERTTARFVANKASQIPGVRQGIIALNPSGVERFGQLGRLQVSYNRLLEIAEASNQFGMAALRRLRYPFRVDRAGNVTGLKTGAGAPSLHVADVLERLPRYEGVTDEMLRWRDTATDLLDEAMGEFVAAGGEPKLLGFAEGESYIPRQVLGKQGIAKTQSALRTTPGARQAFERSRMHEYAAQGIAGGVDYSTDMPAIIETTLNAVRRATVDLQFEAIAKTRGRLASELIPRSLKENVVDAFKEVRKLRRAVENEKARLRITPRKQRPPIRESIAAADQRLKVARAALNKARAERSRAVKGVQSAFVLEGAKLGREEPFIAVTRTPPGALPKLGGRIFAKDELDFLVRTMADRSPKWIKAMEDVSGIARVSMTAFDPGFWFIQGLGPLAKDLANALRGRPTMIWAKGVKGSLEALANPRRHADYLALQFERNPEMMTRFARYYRGLQWSEYVESARPGGLLTRIPGVRTGTQRAQAFFDSYMDVVAIEGWRAGERLTGLNPARLEQLGAHLRNITGNLSTRSLGISRTQRAIEAAFIRFAPRYTRAGFALVFDAAQGGLRGSEARAALGGLTLMGAAMYYGTAKALGQEPSFDPTSGGKFMSVKIGDNYIGLGGIYRSLIRFGGDVVRTAQDDPEALVTPSDDNPMVRFLRSGAAPITGTAWDIFSGETYIGEPLKIDDPDTFFSRVGSRMLPFWLQGALDANGGIKGRAGAAAAEFFGLRTFPVSPWQRRRDARDEVAQGLFSKPYEELNQAQKGKVNENKQVQALTEEAEKVTLGRTGDFAEQLAKRKQEESLLTELVEQGTIGGQQVTFTTQAEDNALLARGEIDGDAWRGRYRERQRAIYTAQDTVRAALGIEFPEGEEPTDPVDRAIDDYFSITPDQFLDPTGEPEWDAYFTVKDAAFDKAVRLGGNVVADFLRPLEEDPVVRRFKRASGLRSDLDEISKWNGLTAEQSQQLDAFSREVSQQTLTLSQETGVRLSQKRVAQFLAEQRGESGLAEWFTAIQSERQRESLRNPEYDAFIGRHGELQEFFPDLITLARLERLGVIEGAESGGLQRLTAADRLVPVAVR